MEIDANDLNGPWYFRHRDKRRGSKRAQSPVTAAVSVTGQDSLEMFRQRLNSMVRSIFLGWSGKQWA